MAAQNWPTRASAASKTIPGTRVQEQTDDIQKQGSEIQTPELGGTAAASMPTKMESRPCNAVAKPPQVPITMSASSKQPRREEGGLSLMSAF